MNFIILKQIQQKQLLWFLVLFHLASSLWMSTFLFDRKYKILIESENIFREIKPVSVKTILQVCVNLLLNIIFWSQKLNYLDISQCFHAHERVLTTSKQMEVIEKHSLRDWFFLNNNLSLFNSDTERNLVFLITPIPWFQLKILRVVFTFHKLSCQLRINWEAV